MAVTRRGYIFGAFLLSLVCVLFIVIAVSSDSWIVSTATIPITGPAAVGPTTPALASSFRYGMFGGELFLYNFLTPTLHTLYMVCLPDAGACAVTCKTDAKAREDEVRAMANGLSVLNPACVPVTEVNTAVPPMDVPPVISFAVYVCVLLFLFLQLLAAVVAAALAIVNATMNPTEPAFGLPGCLWVNGITAFLGLLVMLLFGIYWASSGLNQHLAFSFIAQKFFVPWPALGYSYWLLLGAVLCSLANIGLIQLRAYLLERDPPPPTIKVENHSDGTIFLY
ncbi:hypothetical protein ABMA28_009642 [Loxostege sticticalis]|uniref:Uncharacterized protein n=1 Tax=Loxostege sticticalis TaxID=481309 RepID=A0ABD0SBM5_LOXSC